MSPIVTVCVGCGAIIPLGQRRGRCDPCRKSYEREKSRARRAKQGKTSQRGYGARHEQLRRAWKRSVDAGLVSCARCGGPIEPGEPWDLGHTEDRRGYTGPEHRGCNRGRGERTWVPERRWSREW